MYKTLVYTFVNGNI